LCAQALRGTAVDETLGINPQAERVRMLKHPKGSCHGTSSAPSQTSASMNIELRHQPMPTMRWPSCLHGIVYEEKKRS
jgi:hypothetical protein